MLVIPAESGMEGALDILRSGGVIAHATETCYGFACDLTNPDAVLKLFAIKNRSADQPVSALFASVDEAKRWVEWNDEAERLAREYFPGPLTLILPLQKDAFARIFPMPPGQRQRTKGKAQNEQTSKRANQKRTLGIRISSHPVAMELVKKFGNPLSTTSANLHGRENPYSADDVRKQFENEKMQPDLILDSGTLPTVPPSTVIDLTGNSGDIVRTGCIKL